MKKHILFIPILVVSICNMINAQIDHFEVSDYKHLPVSGLGNWSIKTADFDADGDADIFLCRSYQKDLVLLNDGSGNFAQLPDTASWQTIGGSYDVLLTDLNGDNLPDAIVSRGQESSDSVTMNPGHDQILLNLGGGTFAEKRGNLPEENMDTMNYSTALAEGDFDHDGSKDLLFVNGAYFFIPKSNNRKFLNVRHNLTIDARTKFSPNIYLNSGMDNNADGINEYTRAIQPFRGLDSINLATDVVVRDFNNDGYDDLFIANYYHQGDTSFFHVGRDSAYINKLYINKPSDPGHFYWDKIHFPFFTKSASTSVDAADFDNDGDQDILVTNDANTAGVAITTKFGLYRNDSTLGFVNIVNTAINGTYSPSYYSGFDGHFADMNSDGLLDIFIAGQTNEIFIQRPDHTFDRKTNIALPLQNASVSPHVFNSTRSTVTDLNNDGKNDILLSDWYEQIRMQMQTSAGVFIDTTTTNLPAEGANTSYSVIADFNNDGLSDVASANFEKASHSIFMQTSMVGAYPYFTDHLTLPGLTTNTNSGIDAADINGDGFTDVAVSSSNSSMVSLKLFANTGTSFIDSSGTWLNGITLTSPSGRVRFVDINNDGHPDIYASKQLHRDFLLIWDQSQHKYVDSSTWFPNDPYDHIHADFKDVNNDGWKDAIVSAKVISTKTFLSSSPFPSSRPNYVEYTLGGYDASVAKFAHFNSDTLWDIVEASDGGTYHIRTSMHNGTSGSNNPYTTNWYIPGSAAKINDLIVLDVNGDGLDDIITAESDKSKVYINNGNGTSFTDASGQYFPQGFCETGWFANAVTAADVNNDGLIDLYYSRDNQDLLFYGKSTPLNITTTNADKTYNAVHAYPNPGSGLITFELQLTDSSTNKNAFLKIYDIIGKEVLQQDLNTDKTIVDATSLKSGMYFYSITNERIHFSGKLIVQ